MPKRQTIKQNVRPIVRPNEGFIMFPRWLLNPFKSLTEDALNIELLGLFTWMALKANWIKSPNCKRGQLVTSYTAMAGRFLGDKRLNNSMKCRVKLLIDLNLISVKSSNHGLVITILVYDQMSGFQGESSDQSSDQSSTLKELYNNSIKNEKGLQPKEKRKGSGMTHIGTLTTEQLLEAE